jgi:hypothetical protein
VVKSWRSVASQQTLHRAAATEADTTGSPPRHLVIVKNGVPPLVAFLVGWVLVASRSAGSLARAMHASRWIRRDSGQYLKIAAHGYRLSTHCAGAPRAVGQVVHICGNITWLPGYPAVVRVVSLTGISLPTAAVSVAWACWYLTLLMVWALTDSARTPSRWACVLLAAVFPGQVYFAAAFPISLCTFLMLAAVYAVTVAHRGGVGAAVGFVAGATYLPALALAPGLLVTAVLRRPRRAASPYLLGAGAVVAGLVAVLGYAQLAVGRWDAYFVSEREEYGVRTSAPWRVFIDHVAPMWTGVATPMPGAPPRAHPYLHTIVDTAGVVAARQSALVAMLLLLAVCMTVRRGGMSAPDAALLGTAVVAWLIPYLGGGALSIYRSEACVIVVVPLLRRFNWWQLAAAVAAAGWVAYDLAPLFENYALV